MAKEMSDTSVTIWICLACGRKEVRPNYCSPQHCACESRHGIYNVMARLSDLRKIRQGEGGDQ